jgi:hypothetical protein
MAGQRQKPVQNLAFRRGGRGREVAIPDHSPLGEVPAPPPRLTRAVRDHWEAFWSDQISRLVTEAAVHHVRRYFVLLSERERLERKVSKAPIVPGSAGQDTLNPLYKRLEELTREIEVYMRELGILPLSRMRLGVATGHARSALEEMREQLRRRQEARPQVLSDEEMYKYGFWEESRGKPQPAAMEVIDLDGDGEVIDLATLED